MLTLLLFALLWIASIPDVLRESVDLIELNHYHDAYGRIVFHQVIFYDWSDADRRFNVRTYRLAIGPGYESPTAKRIDVERDFARGGYACVWIDGDVVRSVMAAEFRETWTQWDVEIAEREILRKERRRELRVR